MYTPHVEANPSCQVCHLSGGRLCTGPGPEPHGRADQAGGSSGPGDGFRQNEGKTMGNPWENNRKMEVYHLVMSK